MFHRLLSHDVAADALISVWHRELAQISDTSAG